MTVGELIEILQDFEEDDLVIICDASMTRISVLDDVTVGHYIDAGTHSDFIPEDIVNDDDEVNLDGSTPAVCLIAED